MLYITNIKNINNKYKNIISITNNNNNIEIFKPLIPNNKLNKLRLHNKEYIKKYYIENLKKLDPKTIYNILDNKIIVYENQNALPVYIFISWIELYLNTKIEEIIDNNTEPINNETIKQILEKIIKKELNIKQNSIAAYYLLKQGEKLQNKAEIFLKQNNIKYAHRTLKLAKETINESKNIEKKYNKTRKRKR